jgi:hypothetical protein
VEHETIRYNRNREGVRQMIEKKQMYGMLRVDAATSKEIVQASEDWLSLVRILIQPSFIRIENEQPQPFDLHKIKNAISLLGEDSEVTWLVGNEIDEFSFSLFKGRILEKYLISDNLFWGNHELIKDYLLNKMTFYTGIISYLRSYSEYQYSNVANIKERQNFETEEEIKELPKLKTMSGEQKIDCNQFAGYDIFFKGLCLTSCWHIYFGSVYYSMIPKQIFKEIQQVEFVKEHENEVIEIQLFKNPYNWKHERNLGFQRLFRDQLGIDQLVWDNGTGLLREAYIEYVYPKNFIHTVQYQNDSLQPTRKKEASHFITRTYDLVHETYQEKRVKGALNAQAFFPWIDESQLKMVAYKVIDPELTLDSGLEAYSYYIRDYLEIDVIDDKYPEYEATLRFYIPQNQLTQIPFDQIFERFPDVKIGPVKQKKDAISVELKKEKNHLRVLFLAYEKLEELLGIQGRG